MNKAFWLQLGIKETLKVAQDFVNSNPDLTAAEQTALQNFITAAQGVATAFTGSTTAPSAPAAS
jgi:hypothetical protein